MTKRASIRARAGASARRVDSTAASSSSSSAQASSAQANSAHRQPSKKDKRTAKHDTLLRRIREGGVKKNRTRRPNRKLQAAEDINDLRNALPDISIEDDADEEWEGLSDEEASTLQSTGQRKRRRRDADMSGEPKMVMKSLQHRSGAMKRKRKMEHTEMERFSKNLAQLSGSDVNSKESAAPNVVSAGDKWAALRRFIGGTMEKDKAFSAG